MVQTSTPIVKVNNTQSENTRNIQSTITNNELTEIQNIKQEKNTYPEIR